MRFSQLLVALFLCAVVTAEHTYTAQWSLDGASWTGSTEVRVDLSGDVSVKDGTQEEPWTAEQLSILRLNTTLYRVRLIQNGQPAASLVVHPCALLTSKQYATGLQATTERIGLLLDSSSFRVQALKWQTLFSEQCDLNILRSPKGAVKRLISFTAVRSMSLGALPSFGEPVEPTRKAAEDKTASAQPQENQSFMQKYGMYILAFFVINTLMNAFGPKAKEGGTAQAGQAAAGK